MAYFHLKIYEMQEKNRRDDYTMYISKQSWT